MSVMIPSSFCALRSFRYVSPFVTIKVISDFDGFHLRRTTPRCFYWACDRASLSPSAKARIGWEETPEAYEIKVDMAGMNKKDVKVEVVDETLLRISGAGKEKEETSSRPEASCEKFLRQFRLPESVNVKEIKAGTEDGVLKVTVPKVVKKKSAVKSIPIAD